MKGPRMMLVRANQKILTVREVHPASHPAMAPGQEIYVPHALTDPGGSISKYPSERRHGPSSSHPDNMGTTKRRDSGDITTRTSTSVDHHLRSKAPVLPTKRISSPTSRRTGDANDWREFPLDYTQAPTRLPTSLEPSTIRDRPLRVPIDHRSGLRRSSHQLSHGKSPNRGTHVPPGATVRPRFRPKSRLKFNIIDEPMELRDNDPIRRIPPNSVIRDRGTRYPIIVPSSYPINHPPSLDTGFYRT